MNFLKNTYNKLFSQKENEASTSQAPENANEIADIPEDALTDMFDMTVTFIKESKYPASDQQKLQLYAYFKQTLFGNCNVPKPGLLDFVGKAKWEAWNNAKGMSRPVAMQRYIATAVKVDPTIQKKMAAQFQNEEYVDEAQLAQAPQQQTLGMKMVQQEDFSDIYSHPYFKPINKGEELGQITRELLLQKNNSPAVYPLHFAIEKEREDLVAKFLEFLSKEDIEGMKDQEGTGILQYAELMENVAILDLIKTKLAQ